MEISEIKKLTKGDRIFLRGDNLMPDGIYSIIRIDRRYDSMRIALNIPGKVLNYYVYNKHVIGLDNMFIGGKLDRR